MTVQRPESEAIQYRKTGGDPSQRADVEQSANPGLQSMETVMDPFKSGNFYSGAVIRADAGLYDVVVNCGVSPELPCVVGTGLSSYYLGVSECAIPPEGSNVLVYKPFASANFGIVVCVLPPADLVPVLSEDGKAPKAYYHMLDVEPGKSSITESVYRAIWESPEETGMVNANAGRPLDLFPGEQAWVNEQALSIELLRLMLRLRASDRAKLELSPIDDAVRLVSGYYRHISSQGEEQIYNDGGAITREISGTSYQAEATGLKTIGTKVFGEDKESEDEESTGLMGSSTSIYKTIVSRLAPKKRFQVFLGYMGDLVNFFVANPDPLKDQETSDSESKDQGLFQTHIDTSGRMIVRSAAGISLQRDDIIAVPKKRYEPWDPEGSDAPDPAVISKKPFQQNEKHPGARGLHLRDAQAYHNAQAVQKLNAQADRDYYLPEEKDLATPDNAYDPNGKEPATENFDSNANRKASINLEQDGSIILRDAWGSEIILRDGKIVLNCADNIEIRSGKSIVNTAGHDIIAKALKSIDMVSTDRDVRIKANTNLHMVSEGRQASDEDPEGRGGGGMLFESKAVGETSAFKDVSGENVISSGIIFKAPDSRIFMCGKVVHTNATGRIISETYDADKNVAGDIFTAARNVFSVAEGQQVLSTGDSSALMLTRSQALIAGQSAGLIAGGTPTITAGARVWVPLTQLPIKTNPYEETKNISLRTLKETLLDSDDWLAPYDVSAREDIKFTYRSSAEYGTLSTDSSTFSVYQAAWSYLKGVGDDLVPGESGTWTEHAIDDTYPWPGEAGYEEESKMYVILENETNIEDPVKGTPKTRAEVLGSNSSGKLKEKSFHEYEIIKVI